MKSSIKYVIVADLETGGLPSKESRPFYEIPIIEIAMVIVDIETLLVVDKFTQIVKPYKEGLIYSEQAAAVTGLSGDLIEKEGVDIKEFYKNIKNFIKKYSNKRLKSILCGHNFQMFDFPFLKNMFEYMGEDIGDYVGFIEDTMKIAYYSSLEQVNYKLATCCNESGIELIDGHRALVDTESNALLFVEYVKRLRNQSVKTEVREERFRDSFQIMD